MSLRKQQAIALFGSGAALARALGYTRARISQWPEILDQRQADLVVGAAVRLGIPVASEERAGMPSVKGEPT